MNQSKRKDELDLIASNLLEFWYPEILRQGRLQSVLPVHGSNVL